MKELISAIIVGLLILIVDKAYDHFYTHGVPVSLGIRVRRYLIIGLILSAIGTAFYFAFSKSEPIISHKKQLQSAFSRFKSSQDSTQNHVLRDSIVNSFTPDKIIEEYTPIGGSPIRYNVEFYLNYLSINQKLIDSVIVDSVAKGNDGKITFVALKHITQKSL